MYRERIHAQQRNTNTATNLRIFDRYAAGPGIYIESPHVIYVWHACVVTWAPRIDVDYDVPVLHISTYI